MKSLLITLSIFASISAFSASTKSAKLSPDNRLICVLKEVSHEFKIDYSLSRYEDKTKKLAQAVIFEDYLHTQIRIENEKYDQMAMNRGKRSKMESKRISRSDISKQYKSTMNLLSQAESLARYISWLRS